MAKKLPCHGGGQQLTEQECPLCPAPARPRESSQSSGARLLEWAAFPTVFLGMCQRKHPGSGLFIRLGAGFVLSSLGKPEILPSHKHSKVWPPNQWQCPGP